ncbi:diuretic hormone receptor, partial [Biomphalaria glabrata]
SYCPAYHDSYYCWPDTLANTTVYGPCPFFPSHFGGFRVCTEDGVWESTVTNYSLCVEEISQVNLTLYLVLKDIIFITSIISLLLLIAALFIFCYFR